MRKYSRGATSLTGDESHSALQKADGHGEPGGRQLMLAQQSIDTGWLLG